MTPIYNDNTVGSFNATIALGANPVTLPAPKTAPLPLQGTRVRPVGPPRPGLAECTFPVPTDATQSNATNFQSGDSTLAPIPVALAHLTKSVHISSPERNKGLSLDLLIAPAIAATEADIADIVAAKYIAAALGAKDVEAAQAAFVVANLKTMTIASTAFPRIAMMTTTALMGIAGDLELGADGIWRYPGLNGVYEHNLTGADGYAVVTGPSGLAYVVEKPEFIGPIPRGEIASQEIVLTQLQIPAWVCTWFDKASRTQWASVDLLFGCAIADPTATTYAAPAA